MSSSGTSETDFTAWLIATARLGAIRFSAVGLWILAAYLSDLGNLYLLPFALLFGAAWLFSRLVVTTRIPPLLLMLTMGLVLRAAGALETLDDITSSLLRSTALTIILCRAGLGLDFAKLRKKGGATLRLSFLPMVFEALCVSLFARLFLGMDYIFCLVLGFVIGAVSPAVVVPSLLHLQANRYGTGKGVPSVVMAAASLDDIIAISGFGATVGIAFSTGTSLAFDILKGPLELVIGLFVGACLGGIILALFHECDEECGTIANRFAILLGSGLCCVLGGKVLNFSGSGALAAMMLNFVVAQKWESDVVEPISDNFKWVWKFAEPVLFGLIGAAVDVRAVKADRILGGVATLAISLVVRCCVTFLCVTMSGFNFVEKLFLVAAWTPKATVQAALGPIVVDLARQYGSSDKVLDFGETILAVAVLAIILTAPLGAVLIAVFGPRWLEQAPPGTKESDRSGSGSSLLSGSESSSREVEEGNGSSRATRARHRGRGGSDSGSSSGGSGENSDSSSS